MEYSRPSLFYYPGAVSTYGLNRYYIVRNTDFSINKCIFLIHIFSPVFLIILKIYRNSFLNRLVFVLQFVLCEERTNLLNIMQSNCSFQSDNSYCSIIVTDESGWTTFFWFIIFEWTRIVGSARLQGPPKEILTHDSNVSRQYITYTALINESTPTWYIFLSLFIKSIALHV
jgi:hypothetical protein